MSNFKKKIKIFMLIFNFYLIVYLFFGENTILNFLLYKKESDKLLKQRHELLHQKYQLQQLSSLLEDKNGDADDALDELLRQVTQSTLPEEKIVITK